MTWCESAFAAACIKIHLSDPKEAVMGCTQSRASGRNLLTSNALFDHFLEQVLRGGDRKSAADAGSSAYREG